MVTVLDSSQYFRSDSLADKLNFALKHCEKYDSELNPQTSATWLTWHPPFNSSLTAFERYVNTEDDVERQHKLNIEQIDTLDFVLMFVPIESAFLEAINAQPNLLEEAYKKNVLIVSASNLRATLRTVIVLW